MWVLKSHHVDVVVSDEQMPGMRGGELLRWVAEQFPDVVRMVLTGHATAENAIHAINEGRVYQFFTKPCNTFDLGMAIRKALEHKQLMTSNRLLDARNEQMLQSLKRHEREVKTITAVMRQEVCGPLLSVSRSDLTIENEQQTTHTESHQYAERALDGVVEIMRLLGEMETRLKAATSDLPNSEKY